MLDQKRSLDPIMYSHNVSEVVLRSFSGSSLVKLQISLNWDHMFITLWCKLGSSC